MGYEQTTFYLSTTGVIFCYDCNSIMGDKQVREIKNED